jgi:hypothetical protein
VSKAGDLAQGNENDGMDGTDEFFKKEVIFGKIWRGSSFRADGKGHLRQSSG